MLYKHAMHTCQSKQVKAVTVELDAKMCCVPPVHPPLKKIAEVKTLMTAAISSALGTKVKTPTF